MTDKEKCLELKNVFDEMFLKLEFSKRSNLWEIFSKPGPTWEELRELYKDVE